jgi:hypothetical protein
MDRRAFLASVGIAALSFGIPIGPVKAWVHGSTSFNGGISQVNLNSPQNGGDFPFLNAMKNGQEWSLVTNVAPFVVEPSTLDSNGYPTSIVGGSNGVTTFFFVPLQSERPGNYVIKWTGNGVAYASCGDTAITNTITAASIAAQCVLTLAAGTGNNTFNFRVGQPITVSNVSGTGWAGVNATWPILAVNNVNKTVTIGFNSGALGAATLSGSSRTTNVKTTTTTSGLAGIGRYVFSTTFGGINGFNVGTASVASSVDYPHDMICCHEDDEALIDAGQIVGVKFLSKIAEARFGVVRFLNWQAGNACQITNWASRKPEGYAYYHGTELRASVYAGATLNSGNAYTTAIFPPGGHSIDGTAWISGGPKDKDTVTILFNASATQSGLCSLDIGNTGTPINILNSYSNPLTVGGNSYPILNRLATLVYDAAFNAWIKQGGDDDLSSSGIAAGIRNGVPYETMFKLARACGTHPYFVGAQFANDAATDFTPSLASYLVSNKPSWMIPRHEGTNETWNTAGGFRQTTYAQNRQAVFNGSQVPGGVLTTTTYNASAFVYPSAISGAGFVDITLSTTGNSFVIGSRLAPASFGGISNLPSSGFYVTAINVSGNVNKITVQFTPSGSYTSGGTVTPFTTDFGNWYGKAISIIGQACATAYGGIANIGTKYHVLCGVQGSIGTDSTQAALFGNIRLQSTSFVLNNNPPSPYTASAASNWVSNINTSGYFAPSTYGTGTETTLSNAFGATKSIATIVNGVMTISSTSFGTLAIGQTVFGQNIALSTGVTIASGSGPWTLSDLTINMSLNTIYTGDQSTTPLDTYVAAIPTGASFHTLASVNTTYGVWFAYAQGLTNGKGSAIGMMHYEAGYDAAYTAAGTTALDAFRYAAKFVSAMQTYTKTNFDNFVAAGGTFPSCYQMSGKYPTNNVWSGLENVYQSPNPPEWLAFIAFNH